MKSRKWLWAFALLPLFCLPLIAQEPRAGDPGAQDQQEAPPQAESPPAEQQPEPPTAKEPAQPEERVSVDNNLSFPVDI